MKKIFLISLLLLLTNCNYYKQEDEREIEANFEIICRHDEYYYSRDLDTNIMYINLHRLYAYGFSVYYNEEGKPMTYDEFKVVHIEKYHD